MKWAFKLLVYFTLYMVNQVFIYKKNIYIYKQQNQYLFSFIVLKFNKKFTKLPLLNPTRPQTRAPRPARIPSLCWGLQVFYTQPACARDGAKKGGNPLRPPCAHPYLYLCVWLAVCFVLNNLVITFSPKCVTDSLYK